MSPYIIITAIDYGYHFWESKHRDSQGYRGPAKKIVARPDESVRQPDIVFLAGTGVNKMWFGV